MAAATTCGYETMRSGDVVLFYVNRDGLPVTDRCRDRMWTFCMEQYPDHASQIRTLRDNIVDYPPIICLDPPYHVATNNRYTIHEKLQLIQNFIQRLEYNYTGMQFFDLNASRPLSGLMDTARHIMTESLPIKCFEAFLVAIYLTTGILGLDRFNISFKTRFNSIIYRHIVLGVKYGHSYGALGLSRRTDLAYKPLSGKFDRLSLLIDDYVRSYRSYGHTVLRIKIGLPIIHDLKSFQTIGWKALIIQPNKIDKIEYDRDLDKIVRIWRQMNVYMTWRPIIPSASIIQPTGNVITAASLPNRLQPISFRQNRQTSMIYHRRSATQKILTNNENTSTDNNEQTFSCAIRV